jgi:hypothetical protein
VWRIACTAPVIAASRTVVGRRVEGSAGRAVPDRVARARIEDVDHERALGVFDEAIEADPIDIFEGVVVRARLQVRFSVKEAVGLLAE